MIEAVIFDMDGVLADTEYYYENRRKNFLLENGIPIPEGNFIGSNEKAIWEAIVPNDPVRRQEMLMAYREYRKARPTPYGKLTDPQAEPLMNALRSRGLKVAVASSSAAPDARALTFLHRFDALTTVVDAKDYGLGNAVDSSVITYFNPLMHTAVFRVYAEELSYVRQHPLTLRRYMWKLEY